MFTPPKLHIDNNNFITFDIESLFTPYKSDEDNKRYVRIHQPWMISYQMVCYQNGKYEVNEEKKR
jgi:hypothetical protein